jgi:pimeloyl-ACP methyl ester carboxylesterase
MVGSLLAIEYAVFFSRGRSIPIIDPLGAQVDPVRCDNSGGDAKMEPATLRLPYLLNGRFYGLQCTLWGDRGAPPVVCVHGLTRQGRDFDRLARALAPRCFVICPDLPGRGGSDRLPDMGLYTAVSYLQALSHLLAWVGRPVGWVGTSLGGICGMLLAASPGTPIARMVLNDIGPFIPKAALARIAAYTAEVPAFPTRDDVETYLRRIHAPFGRLSDADWAAMAAHSSRLLPDGTFALHYDPAITALLRASEPQDVDLWPAWAAIRVPVLTLRGETSDLLLPDTLARMAEKSATHTVADAGHAPALMDEPTIGVVSAFLEQ